MLVYGRYTRSTHVNLPAGNSHGSIRLTQHFFKEGGGGYPLLYTGNVLLSCTVLYGMSDPRIFGRDCEYRREILNDTLDGAAMHHK